MGSNDGGEQALSDANQRDRLLLRLPRSPRATGVGSVRLDRSTRRRPAAILFLLNGNVSPPVSTALILSFLAILLSIRNRCGAKR